MNEHLTSPVETGNNQPLAPLVERLDPSIGEVSTMMGAMMTELLRRTLRGSVRQIDEELQGEVSQKVDATIAERLPGIEQSAAAAADKTAREAATEVALEEVQALEQRAKEAERAIVSRIETSARAAEQQTAESARALTGKIELVEQNAELAITTKAHELTNHIEATAKTATTQTEEKARELFRHIEEAERRANDAAQAEAARQVEELVQRSKKTTAGLKDRIQALEEATSDRKTEHLNLRADIDNHMKARLAAEEQLRLTLEREVTEARQRNEALAKRVTELEKPRGLRALWAWLFGPKRSPETPIS